MVLKETGKSCTLFIFSRGILLRYRLSRIVIYIILLIYLGCLVVFEFGLTTNNGHHCPALPSSLLRLYSLLCNAQRTGQSSSSSESSMSSMSLRRKTNLAGIFLAGFLPLLSSSSLNFTITSSLNPFEGFGVFTTVAR